MSQGQHVRFPDAYEKQYIGNRTCAAIRRITKRAAHRVTRRQRFLLIAEYIREMDDTTTADDLTHVVGPVRHCCGRHAEECEC